MSEEMFRRFGAIGGLLLGLGLMWSLGYGGLIPGALFGATGAVAGGMTGERLARRRSGGG